MAVLVLLCPSVGQALGQSVGNSSCWRRLPSGMKGFCTRSTNTARETRKKVLDALFTSR